MSYGSAMNAAKQVGKPADLAAFEGKEQRIRVRPATFSPEVQKDTNTTQAASSHDDAADASSLRTRITLASLPEVLEHEMHSGKRHYRSVVICPPPLLKIIPNRNLVLR